MVDCLFLSSFVEFVEFCRVLSRFVEFCRVCVLQLKPFVCFVFICLLFCRVLSSFVELCRALSSFVELCLFVEICRRMSKMSKNVENVEDCRKCRRLSTGGVDKIAKAFADKKGLSFSFMLTSFITDDSDIMSQA